MYLHPIDRDAFLAALRDAEESTGLADGCTPGLMAIRVPQETARYLVGSLADSLGMVAYDRLRNRPRPGREIAGSDVVTFCVAPALRDRLTVAFDGAKETGDRDGGLEIGVIGDVAHTLLATAALALNVEIHPRS